MDPNEALRKAREAFENDDYETAAEYYNALDDWLDRGGFLPTRWAVMQKGKETQENETAYQAK